MSDEQRYRLYACALSAVKVSDSTVIITSGYSMATSAEEARKSMIRHSIDNGYLPMDEYYRHACLVTLIIPEKIRAAYTELTQMGDDLYLDEPTPTVPQSFREAFDE